MDVTVPSAGGDALGKLLPSTAARSFLSVIRKLAEAAVMELEAAVRVATSQQIVSQWDWIVSEDPDLAGLRAEPEFRRFESDCFPSPALSPKRPSNIVQLVAARHSANLFHECAVRRETEWHARAEAAGEANPHVALQWWEEEREAWRLARDLSLNHRHWQTRLEVIRNMQQFSRLNGLGDFHVSQPAYSDERIDADRAIIDHQARGEVSYLDRRLASDGDVQAAKASVLAACLSLSKLRLPEPATDPPPCRSSAPRRPRDNRLRRIGDDSRR